MRCLREFLENPYVLRIVAACRESRAVQGILIEIHPIWMRAWRIGERFNPVEPASGYKDAMSESVYARSLYFPYIFERSLSAPWLPFRPLTAADLQWRPLTWGEWDVAGTYSSWPVVMWICLYPPDKERGTPPEFRGEGFRILYEVRPVARLCNGPRDQHRPVLGGVSIGVDWAHAGTMGGILTDGKRNYFGLTCAHVTGSMTKVEQPAHIDGKGGVIGDVVRTQLPPAFPSHAQRIKAVQKQYAAKVDASIVELHVRGGPVPMLEVLKMGKITGLIDLDDIGQGEELQLTGRTSDWQKVERSSVSPFYNVVNKQTGDEYCYENALIFREPTGAAAAQPGDSGAWLCKEVGTDYRWAGMVVGGDTQLGIAVAAHELKKLVGGSRLFAFGLLTTLSAPYETVSDENS